MMQCLDNDPSLAGLSRLLPNDKFLSISRNDMKLIAAFTSYIDNYFPVLEIRYLHAWLAILIIWQIINSNFIHMTHLGAVKSGSLFFLWLHIFFGIATIIFTLCIMRYMLFKQSFKQFFPYLYGDNHVIKDDINQLRHGRFPPPQPQGIANIVQGLGVGALVLIEIAAIVWLVLWLNDSSYANDAREIHKTLTGLIETYLIAHAGMAVLHFYLERNQYLK